MVTPPSYTIEEDEPKGVVRMMVAGFFDRQTLVRHFADNAKFVTRWRAAGRPIRVLIDALNLQPHTPENQALVVQSFGQIYSPGDRVAIMVGSSLVKMQMRRTHTYGDIIDFFMSETAALKWLAAHD
jgi:hypothetical protein